MWHGCVSKHCRLVISLCILSVRSAHLLLPSQFSFSLLASKACNSLIQTTKNSIPLIHLGEISPCIERFSRPFVSRLTSPLLLSTTSSPRRKKMHWGKKEKWVRQQMLRDSNSSLNRVTAFKNLDRLEESRTQGSWIIPSASYLNAP